MGKSFSKWRRFIPSTPIHVYSRSYDHGVIFYDEILIAVHFAILNQAARTYNVKILAITHNITHFHVLVNSTSKEDFVTCFTVSQSIFAREYNSFTGRNGALFHSPFQYAPKCGSKKVRTCLNYIANNGTEKGLSRRAIDFRWNYLAYSRCSHPFSEAVDINTASLLLQNAMESIRNILMRGSYPRIAYLLDLRGRLDRKEWSQLMDFIFSSYCKIDFNLASSYYGGLESMIYSPDDNTGSEYDLNERTDGLPYFPYKSMAIQLFSKGGLWTPYPLVHEQLVEKVIMLSHLPGVTPKHIAGFLHIGIVEIESILFGESW